MGWQQLCWWIKRYVRKWVTQLTISQLCDTVRHRCGIGCLTGNEWYRIIQLWWHERKCISDQLTLGNLSNTFIYGLWNQQNLHCWAFVVRNPRAMDAFCVQRVIHAALWSFCCKPEPAINSSPPSAAYICHWIRSVLVQIMACRIFGAKPLS